MAGISGISFNNFYGLGSDGVNTLFGSMNQNISGVSSLSGLTGDYDSIRNGSYGKLLKAYYGQNTADATEASSSTSSKKAQSTRMNKTLSDIKANADSLKNSADKLTAIGDKSVFAKKSVTKDGATKEEYDREAIYKSVSNFVDSYNNAIDSGKNSTSSSVASAISNMKSTTSVMNYSLSKLGISANKDGKLSIDEKAFKKADMDAAKTLFNGASSYAANIATNASRLSGTASNQIFSSGSTTYGASGSYAGSQVGSLYNSFF